MRMVVGMTGSLEVTGPEQCNPDRFTIEGLPRSRTAGLKSLAVVGETHSLSEQQAWLPTESKREKITGIGIGQLAY